MLFGVERERESCCSESEGFVKMSDLMFLGECTQNHHFAPKTNKTKD